MTDATFSAADILNHTARFMSKLERHGLKTEDMKFATSHPDVCEAIVGVILDARRHVSDIETPLPLHPTEEATRKFLEYCWKDAYGSHFITRNSGLSEGDAREKFFSEYSSVEKIEELLSGCLARDRNIVVMYFGLDGEGERSIEQIAAAVERGVGSVRSALRERICRRKISFQLRKMTGDYKTPAPREVPRHD